MADYLTGETGGVLPNSMTSDEAESQIRRRGIGKPTTLSPSSTPVEQRTPSTPSARGIGRSTPIQVEDDPLLADIVNRMKGGGSQTSSAPVASGQPQQQSSGDPIMDDIVARMKAANPALSAPAIPAAPAPTTPAPTANQDQGDFSRNFAKSGYQAAQTAYGTAALIGDTIGVDSMKNWGLEGYKQYDEKVKAVTKDTDSFMNVLEGKGDIVDWMQGAAGYLTGQALEFGASALAGAAIGSAAPGAGTVGGAVTGFVAKEAVKKGIRGKIAGMLEGQMAKSIAAGMTEQEAAKAVGRTVMAGLGAKAGTFLASSTMELGSIYGDALEESAKTGNEYSLGKVWLSGIGAAALDSAVDWANFGQLTKAFGSKDAAKSFLKEAFKAGAREGLTEGVQTGIERWGANKSLTDPEAIREYIDSAALGAFGGSVIGGTSQQISKYQSQADTNAPEIDSTKVTFSGDSLLRTAQADPTVFAALHRSGDAALRTKIETIASDAGVLSDMREALADNAKLTAGNDILRSNQQFATRLKDSINAFNPTKSQTEQTQSTNEETSPVGGSPVEAGAGTQGAQRTLEVSVGRPNYESVAQGAVTAQDSLDLQNKSPEVKPVFVGTNAEIAQMKKDGLLKGKHIFKQGENSYVIDGGGAKVVFGTKDKMTGVQAAKKAITAGGDELSKALGYPARENKPKAKTIDVAVTKQGDVTTDVPTMTAEAAKDNIAYAAEGSPVESVAKAEKVAAAVQGKKAKAPVSLTPTGQQASWVVREKATGKAVMETFEPAVADAINTEKYEVVPITEHLQSLNKKPEATVEQKVEALTKKAKAGKLTDAEKQDAKAVVAEGRKTVEELNATADRADNAVAKATAEATPEKPAKAEPKQRKGRRARNVTKEDMAADFKAAAQQVEQEQALETPAPEKEQVAEKPAKKAIPAPKKALGPVDKLPAGSLITKTDAQKALKGLSEYTRQKVFRPLEDLLRNRADMTNAQVMEKVDDVLAGINKVIDTIKADHTPISEWTKTFYSGNLKRQINTMKKDMAGAVTTTRGENIIAAALENLVKNSRQGLSNINRTLVEIENRDAQEQISEKLATPADVQVEEVEVKRGRPKASKDPMVAFSGKPFTEFSLAEFAETDDKDVYLAGGGLGYLSEDKWFKSFDDAMKKASKNKDKELQTNLINSIKDTELAEYEAWKAARGDKIAQLKKKYGDKAITREQVEALLNDPNWVFSESLFMRVPLDIFLNPQAAVERGVISEGEARLLQTKGAGKEGDKAWFESIDNAIMSRPDLEEKILAEELSADERVRYEEFQKHQARSIDLAHRMRAIADGLRNSGGIFEDFAEGDFETRAMYEFNSAVARLASTLDRSFANGVTNLLLDAEHDPIIETEIAEDGTKRTLLRRSEGSIIAANVAVDMEVKRMLSGLENAPNVVTAISWKETPESVSAAIEKAGGDEAVPKGYFDAETGTVYIFSENIENVADLQFTLFHEMYGHYGLRGLMNEKELNSFLNQSFITNPQVRSRVQELQNMYPELKADKMLAIEEAISDIAAEGKNLSLFQRFMGLIQYGLRKAGWNNFADQLENMSGVEFARTLKAAREYVRKGGEYVTYGGNTETLFVRAGHVSRSKFDQFAEENIGSGFGLAYGHGWYFYADKKRGNSLILSVSEKGAPLSFSIDGKPISSTMVSALRNFRFSTERDAANAYILDALPKSKDGVTIDEIADAKQQAISNLENDKEDIARKLGLEEDMVDDAISNIIDRINETNNITLRVIPRDVFVYDVDLNDKRFENMALYHSPLSEQPKVVQDFFAGKMEQISPFLFTNKEPTFGDLQTAFKYSLMDKGISEDSAGLDAMHQMREAGIPGNRHILNLQPDQKVNSYDGSDVVVYDNKVININETKRIEDGKPLLKRGKKTAVEINAMKGGKFVGLATFNPVLQEWTVFTGADVSAGQFTTRIVDNVDEAVKLLKDTGGKLTYDEAIDHKTMSNQRLTLADKGGDSKFIAKIKDRLRYAVMEAQNRYLPVKHKVYSALESVGLDDAANVWQKVVLFDGRAGSRIEQFGKDYVEPITQLVKDITDKGGKLSEVDEYLYARHAGERNATLQERGSKKNSGISTEKAEALLEAYDKKPYGKQLQEIGAIIDKMSKAKIELMLEYGLISKQSAEGLSRWKHYVNLSGLDEVEDSPVGNLGNRFNQNTKVYNATLGRISQASDVLARTINDFQGKIIRGEKNVVAQSVVKFVEELNDKNFATIGKPKSTRQVLVNGKVRTAGNPFFKNDDDVMIALVDGHEVPIQFAESGPESFAAALKGMYEGGMPSGLLRLSAVFNQAMSRLITVWAPDWAVVNGIRDIQTAYLNMRSDLGKEKAERMAQQTVGNIKNSLRYFMGKMSPEERAEMDAIYDRLDKAGGMTHFLRIDSVADAVKKIEGDIKNLQESKASPTRAIRKTVEILERFNGAIEAAPRVAAFKVLIENGVSDEQAAMYAKELTVNFNIRGRNQVLTSLYLFFNPAVQGTERLYRAISSPTGMKLAAGLFTLGIVSGLFGRAAGGTDEDGIDRIDKISDFKRATSIILAPDVPGAAIPLPYGWNFFHAAGVYMSDFMFGGKSMADVSWKAMKAAISAFSPVGGNDAQNGFNWLLKTIVPQIGKPIVEYALNDNAFGSPIRKTESPFSKVKEPSSQQYFDSVSPFSRTVTEKLNKLFGGNELASSSMLTDINPAMIDHFIRGYLPGLASATYETLGESYKKFVIGEKSRDTETSQYLSKLPGLRRISAATSPAYDNVAFRKLSEVIETKYAEAQRMAELGESTDKINAEYPNLFEAHEAVKHYGGLMQKTSTATKQVQRSVDYPDNVKVETKNNARELTDSAAKEAVKNLIRLGYGKYL